MLVKFNTFVLCLTKKINMDVKDIKERVEIHEIDGIKYVKIEDLENFEISIENEIFILEKYISHVKDVIKDNISEGDIFSFSRKKENIRLRMILSSVVKRTRNNGKKVASLAVIGKYINKDHATVMHYDKTLMNLIETKWEDKQLVDKIFKESMLYSESLSYLPFEFN